jgi:uncharacterized protein (TIGR03437 family)
VTLIKQLPLLVLVSASSLLAVPRLRLASTVVGPLTVNQGANVAATSVEAYSIADRDLTVETENLRLTLSSSAPWVTAVAQTARGCSLRVGQCIPLQLNFSTQQLAAGAYTATVLVADPNAIDAPQKILVRLSVGSTLPDRLNFYAAPNGSTDQFEFHTNQAAPGTRIETSVSPSGAWLTVIQDTAGSFNAVTPFFIRAKHQPGQAEGAYTGTLIVRNSALASDNKTVNVGLQVTSQPIATIGKPGVRVRLAQGAATNLERLRIVNRGLGRLNVTGATATMQTPGSWLTATRLDGFEIVDLTFNSAGTPPGVYKGALSVAHNGANSPLNIPVEFEVVPQAPPAIRLQGVLENAAFEEGDVLAAGGIVAAFGEQFTYQDPAVAGGLPLPQELAGVRVLVNDRPAPVYYASYGQVNFQVPYDVTSAFAAGTVRIDRGSTRGNTIAVNFVPAAPKFMRLQLRAAGLNIPEVRDFFGIAVHLDGTLSLPREFGIPNSRPSKPGDVITMYGLGFGQTAPPLTAGTAAAASPLPVIPTTLMKAYFGALALLTGASTDAFYVGATPGFAGLYQVNMIVPQDSPKGDVPIRVHMDKLVTEYALIAVE